MRDAAPAAREALRRWRDETMTHGLVAVDGRAPRVLGRHRDVTRVWAARGTCRSRDPQTLDDRAVAIRVAQRCCATLKSVKGFLRPRAVLRARRLTAQAFTTYASRC
jgi:hypothetical protein